VQGTIGTHMNIRTQETAGDGVFVVVTIITGETKSSGYFSFDGGVNKETSKGHNLSD